MDEALPVTFGDVEVTKITLKVGEYSSKKEFVNAAQFIDKVIAEVDLKPKDKIKIKASGKKLHDSEDKKALLHLRITADGGTETEYCNEDLSLSESSSERSILLNIEQKYFELAACFCDRNFSLEELKTIVKNLRNEEKIKTTALFFDGNCPLPAADKTYERFLEELNAMLNKFGINTCIRKLHFLAQSYHESGRFGTTLEGASGDGYDPGAHREASGHGHTIKGDGRRYKGRGFIQITWRDQQKKYLIYASQLHADLLGGVTVDELFDRSARYEEKYIYAKKTIDSKGKKHSERVEEIVNVDGAALIANNLTLAMDSAGWYWRNLGHITATNEDINPVADTDNILKVSQCINGRVSAANLNGLTERTKYLASLKKIMNFETCVNKQQ
ncbi:MAG: hypothetical protein ABI378_15595 [Chitinophagaceae bacterium]